MSQHDMSVANASGSAVRTDLNNALGAIQTTHIGSSAPASVAAGQLWIDNSATPWVLKCYDGSDHITVGTINASTNAFNLAVAQGGTGAATAAAAATNLGLGTGDSPNFDATQTKSQLFQCFEIQLINSAGTLQHRFHADESLTLPTANYISKITGASATLQNTPSVSSGVDFTAGGGIVPANIFILDTAAQTRANKAVFAIVSYNTTGTDLMVEIEYSSANVNGTTQLRPMLHVTSTAAGAGFTLDTGSIASGKQIRFQVFGYLA